MPSSINIEPGSENGRDFLSVTQGQTNTRIEFDCPETVAIDAGWFPPPRVGMMIGATASENKGADSQYARNMRYWVSGCWTLKPYQELLSFWYELVDFADVSQYRPTGQTIYSRYELIMAEWVKFAIWSEPSGVGFVHEPSVALKGDVMYRRAISAGTTWASGLALSPPPPQLSTAETGGLDQFDGTNVPLDCVTYGSQTSPANQAFFLRWLCPGVNAATPDTILNFYFGQYCVIIGGSGEAILCEYCQPASGGAYRWRKRATFRYSKQSQAVNTPHTMVIFPHRGPQGQKFIVFSGNSVENSQKGGGGLFTAPANEANFTDEYKYTASYISRGDDLDPFPEDVTGAARVRMDIRRDLRVGWHISDLIYKNEGSIVDSVWGVPDYTVRTVATSDYPAKPFQIKFYANYPPDPRTGAIPSIDPLVLDADDTAATDIRKPYVILPFHGTGTGPKGYSYTSPQLWGYQLFRPATNRIINPGMMSLPVQSVSVSSISGPDVRQERGQVVAQDVLGTAAPRLKNRGHLAARVVVDYTDPEDIAGGAKPVVLQRGYALRPRGIKRGKPGKSYPSPEWREWSLLLSSISIRANAVSGHTISRQLFSVDDAAPDDPDYGGKPPWKVTDIIRFMLEQRGFLPSQVIIEDNPIRLWSGGGASEEQIFDTNTDVLERCVNLARNYLGAYLIWDCNAGPLDSAITLDTDDKTPQGAWRLMFAPDPDAEPIYNFVTDIENDLDDGSGFNVIHGTAAYNEKTTFVKDNEVSYCVAPEGNHVWVFTAPELNSAGAFKMEAHCYNALSYYVPGMGVLPDPESPHYLGYESMIIVPDASLIVQGDQDGSRTRASVDFTARRIFDYACRGRIIQPFRGPLVMVVDAQTNRPRPLRYYDPVTYNGEGDWYIRSVSPSIGSIHHWADYEIEKLAPYP